MARARAQLAAGPASGPTTLRISFTGARADAARLYERHGFRLRSVALEQRRALRGSLAIPIPAASLPDGVVAVRWTPARAGRFYAACRAAFGDAEPPEADWIAGVARDPTLRPDLFLVAVAGEEPAGFTLCEVVERGGRAGWIWQVGVTPRWRRRGVATALLCAALRAFRAEGLPEGGLIVDEQNVAARRVYEQLGFRTVTRETIYEQHAGRSREPGAREEPNRT